MRLRDSFNEQCTQLDDQLLGSAHWPIEQWDGHALEATLNEVQRSHGTELATAWLYRALVQHPNHREFVEQFEANLTSDITDETPLKVCIVPGAFYREYPRIDSSGQALRDELQRCGITTQFVPVKSTGSVDENARIIRSFLRDHSSEPLALISLSKGGSDIKVALRQSSEDFQNVRLWYSISGTLSGVELVNWVQRRWWARAMNTLFFRLSRRDWKFFSDMARGPEGSLDFSLECPSHLTIVHVAAFPLRRHTQTRMARAWYRRFEILGPTDSMIMLRELLHVPGHVLPIWGVDHYWKQASAVRLIARGFAQHARQLSHPEPPCSNALTNVSAMSLCSQSQSESRS